MEGIRILVCLKVVPKPEEVRINPETRTLDRARARSEINPPDLHALEMALELKDRWSGWVGVASMGPPFFEPYLRTALAMGADAAYLLSDRSFAGADTLATAYTLARGIARVGAYDLVLCGEESSDGATGQVPAQIGEWLGIPHVTYASRVELLPDVRKAKVRRELGGGYEVVAVPLPAVVSVRVGVNEPRFLDPLRMAWAEDASITVWSARDLEVDPELVGTAGSPTVVAGIHEAAGRERRREILLGTPEEKADLLVDRLRDLLRELL
ncbi:MAG: electron transfer flavoprotein subunit beta/FixA family protein [Armatimonadota bacterium]|nr:electron transfer flavoprotein subunit beta/FixA family protein [Armatimonadota bacterium]MDR7440096.1 electron transfer flavoprotein subunit beta/FixA family protein [Armatimonadota bacterium]MDR7563584.1 electron transfer flavoprotein subunit beta/FixA family protein [Armatimonadota bacterium]MDR7602196.1 electron transfer flavoprotein subunit beta/FixA family protein [Armatimonadota bacterium]